MRVSGSISGWRSATSGASQRSVLGPLPFNTFISNINSGVECTLNKFADDAKLWDAVNTPEEEDAIQKNLDRLEQRAQANLMRFNKSKCKMLHLDRGKLHYQ